MEGHILLSAIIALACGFAALHLARVGFAILAVFLTTAIILMEAIINGSGFWQVFTTWLLSACLFQVGYVLSMVFSAFFKPNARLGSMLESVKEPFWAPILYYFNMRPKRISHVEFVEKQKITENDRDA